MTDPIETWEWVHVDNIRPNDWNPNFVFSPEMKLLEESLLRNGWLQAIIINPNGIIIDGFHRFKLSCESKKVQKRWKGQVPAITLDISDAEAKMLTVRINRAKGTHTGFRMSELVQQLIDDHGLSVEEIRKGIGATADEVDLLYKGGVFKKRDLDHWEYSKAWVPEEVPNAPEEEPPAEGFRDD